MNLTTLSYAAGQWSQALPDLDSSRTLVLAFGATRFRDDPGPLRELRAKYPRSHVIGCSTAGEIHGTKLSDDSISVAIARFDWTDLTAALTPVRGPGDSRGAGERIARQLAAPSLRAVLVLSDGLGVNGSELIRGLNDVFPASVLVTGGLAGDGDRFKRTWVTAGADPLEGHVVAIGLHGDHVRFGHGSKGGWDIFGLERTVTRSEGNVLYELDGRPALQLYREYLGERAAGLPATGLLFPLALRNDAADEKRLVRTVLAIDEERSSMTFAGDVPQGSLAQLMRANFDRLVQGASDAAHRCAIDASTTGDTLAIAISCVGRRLVLGERIEEEIEATVDALPKNAAQVGFYSYGELSPYAAGRCDLHNQTMTLTTLSEVT